MRTPDDHPTRREAERLLDDPAAHGSALGSLLSAASAPAQPGELRREDAEVASFHRARLAPQAAGAGFVSPGRLASRAAARAVIATGAVVALTTGGFALASSTHLPGLPDQASDRATESVAKTPKPTAPSTSTSTATSTSTSTTDPTDTPSGSAESPSASTAPTPSYEGLCRAFQAADHSANGSSLDSAAFAALSAAAGGADQVATWCVALIGEPQETGKPSVLPTPTAKPSPTRKPAPTSKPSVLPTPTATPTQVPTSQPTGKPSTAPGKPTDQPIPTDKGGGRKP